MLDVSTYERWAASDCRATDAAFRQRGRVLVCLGAILGWLLGL